MKNVKKLVFGMALVVGTTSAVSAQESYVNTLKIGASAGVGTEKTSTAALGLDVSYQYLVSPHFGFGVATGYSHYFGKSENLNNLTIKYQDFGVVPIAALLRLYHSKSGFYLGADLGISLPTGDYKITVEDLNENTTTDHARKIDGGFYAKPMIGFHNKDWNFTLHYQHVGLANDLSKSNVGLGFSYNIPLGAK